jgi:hypothetical protein
MTEPRDRGGCHILIRTANENYVKKALQGPAIVNHILTRPAGLVNPSSPNSNTHQDAAARLCLAPVSVVKERLRDTRICLLKPPLPVTSGHTTSPLA